MSARSAKLSREVEKSLLRLLNDLKSIPPRANEIGDLERFLTKCALSKVNDFSGFGEMISLILSYRLPSAHWKNLLYIHKLRILQTLRVFSRDHSLAGEFLRGNVLKYLTRELEAFVNTTEDQKTLQNRERTAFVGEILQIIKKYSAHKLWQQTLISTNAIKLLLQLLSSCEAPSVVQNVLICLTRLCSNSEAMDIIVRFKGDRTLLHIAMGDTDASSSAIDMISLLAKRRDSYLNTPRIVSALVRKLGSYATKLDSDVTKLDSDAIKLGSEATKMGSNAKNLGFGRSRMCSEGGSEKSTRRSFDAHNPRDMLSTLRCLGHMTSKNLVSRRQIYAYGGISKIMEILKEKRKGYTEDGKSRAPTHAEGCIVVAICKILAQVSADEDIAHQILQHGGIVEMCSLLLIYKDDQDTKGGLQVQSNSLRVLRILQHSSMRKKDLKRIIPKELFQALLGIQMSQVFDIAPYRPLARKFSEMSGHQRENMVKLLREFHEFTKTKKILFGMRVEETLGRGSFGTVYLVSKNREKWALKEIPLHSNQPNPKADFQTEVEILSSMHHPNIVRLLKSYGNEENMYILMEYVSGQSLKAYIGSKKNRDEMLSEDEDIWPIFAQICQGLNYLHNVKKITHRDLTPSNVMLTAGRKEVKITDFGLARFRGEGSLMKTFVGTISYSAPEMIQHLSYTEKIDIWTLGCVLYEMITLDPPFQGGNPIELAQRIVTGKYKPIVRTIPTSNLLNQVVIACLTVEPSLRPDINSLTTTLTSVLLTQMDFMSRRIQQQKYEFRREKMALRNNIDDLLRQYRDSSHRALEGKKHKRIPPLLRISTSIAADNQERVSIEPRDFSPKSRSYHHDHGRKHSTNTLPPISISPSRGNRMSSNYGGRFSCNRSSSITSATSVSSVIVDARETVKSDQS
ncbi:hypothetical protein AAMO2058_000821900 [Amorphochlora amoebiformis]